MKKSILALGLAFAALTLPSCSQNEELDVTPVVTPSFELYANIDTRTVNDGVKTNWVAGDQINVFHAEAGATEVEYVNDNAFKTEEADGLFKGSLAGELTAEAYDWFALYPYSSYVTTPASADRDGGYTTVGAKVQAQNGNNSMAHLDGDNCPLVGVATGVAAGVKPEFTMNHITAVAKFVVKNTLSEAITVKSIEFTAPDGKLITGTYYVNFVKYPSVVYTGSGDNYTSNVATLKVNDGTAIAAGESAEFYLAMVPFTLEVGDALNIKVSATAGENTIVDEADVELDYDLDLKAGHIKVFNVNFDTTFTPEVAVELPFEETFETNQGDFTTEDIELGSLSYVWSHDTDYKCMKASGYKGSAQNAKSKLVSPLIAIPAESEDGAPILSFDHAIGYGNNTTKDELTLWVKAKSTDWQQVTIPNYPTIGSSFSSFVSSGDIDLSAYKGQNIYIAFEYSSTTAKASTWEIKNVAIASKKFSQTISFAEAAFTLNVGDTFEGQQVTGAKTTVTYASDNTDVAAVNAQTGVVTLGTTPGTAVITATAAEDATYYSATAVYTITLNEAGVETATATLSFADAANRTSSTTTQQVWEQNGVTLHYNKGSYNSNLAENANPMRFYSGTNIVISTTLGTITAIEFDCNSNSYATALVNSIGTSATVSQNNDKVTVTLLNAAESFTVTMGAQVRMDALTITYISNGSVAKENQSISFEKESYTTILGETFTTPTLNGAQTTVTYTSSNAGVATVDESTGAVTIVGVGTTTITATAAESDEYYGATAKYTLTVTAPATGDDGTINVGAVLWSETFSDYGGTASTFASNKTIIDDYDYSGRSGFGDNATSVTLTADASNNVRCTTTTGTNCSGGHLWFNKSASGTLTSSAIKLYGVTSLSFSHAQGTGGSMCTSEYSTDGGSTWTKLGDCSGSVAKQTYSFTVPEGTESIQIKLSHPATNAKNTRVDNLELVVAE